MMAHRSRVLRKRAEALAKAQPPALEQVHGDAIIIVSIGSERIGIPLLTAREVVPYDGATPIPNAPHWLRGVVQIRGELISVLDLETWWDLQRSGSGKHLVVVEGRPGALGIVADSILDVREASDQDYASTLSSEAAANRPGSEE